MDVVRKSSILNFGQITDKMQKKIINCMEYQDECELQSSDYNSILSWCFGILNLSPSARIMLKEVSDKGWNITFDNLDSGDYLIDVEKKLLIFDNNSLDFATLERSRYFKNDILVNMIKALRDIWQENRHGGFDEIYSPEHILLMERIRAADLDVVSILIAWELRSEDHSEIWRHIMASENGDMAIAFSGYLERNPSSLFNGQALRHCFKQWFRCSKRLDACDHDILEYLDDILLSSDITNPFGNKKPSKINIEIMSCLPDKTAYLQGYGTEILNNPIYSSVDNEINQTHLFHIMYDLEAVIVENVPFRDAELARKIFPEN